LAADTAGQDGPHGLPAGDQRGTQGQDVRL
jgi:hypothetical protein